MSHPRRGEALLARVEAEVRLEGRDGPYVAPQEVLEITRRGLLEMLTQGFAILAQEGGLTGDLPRVEVDYSMPVPGSFMVHLDVMDPRPPLVRMLVPVPASKREEIRTWLRWAAEMVSLTLEIVPPVVAARSLRVSSRPDRDGFCTLVIDDRRTVRVPRLMFQLFQSDPRMARASRKLLTAFRMPELRSLVLVRDPELPERRHETVVDLSDEVHRLMGSVSYDSLVAKVQFDEAPLRELLTRNERRKSFGTGIAGMQTPQ